VLWVQKNKLYDWTPVAPRVHQKKDTSMSYEVPSSGKEFPFRRSFFREDATHSHTHTHTQDDGAAVEALVFYTFEDDQELALPPELALALSHPDAHFVEIECGRGCAIRGITGSRGLYLHDSQVGRWCGVVVWGGVVCCGGSGCQCSAVVWLVACVMWCGVA
jgi:hypothetical protein